MIAEFSFGDSTSRKVEKDQQIQDSILITYDNPIFFN